MLTVYVLELTNDSCVACDSIIDILWTTLTTFISSVISPTTWVKKMAGRVLKAMAWKKYWLRLRSLGNRYIFMLSVCRVTGKS